MFDEENNNNTENKNDVGEQAEQNNSADNIYNNSESNNEVAPLHESDGSESVNSEIYNQERPYEQFIKKSNEEDYVWNNTAQQYNNVYQDHKNQKKRNPLKIALAVMLSVVVVGTGGMLLKDGLADNTNTGNSNKSKIGSTNTVDNSNVQKTTVETSKTGSSASAAVIMTDVSGVVQNVMPSIVSITSTTLIESGYSWGPWGNDGQTYESKGAGSGIIVQQTDTELLIVTNNHVVEGATKLSVQFINDVSVDAVVKGTHADNDLAVVAIPIEDIDEETLAVIKKATLGDSDQLKVGEGVIAIGNALGYGQSVTTGVISAKDRQVEVEEGQSMTMLQTDAAINGGNSGGALLNSRGEVIGINAAKYSSSDYSSSSIEGMGFAIPITSATDIINELMNKVTKTKVAEAKRGYLGIYGEDISAEEIEKYSLPAGVLVNKLIEGGASEKAGIEVRDIITKIDGESVTSMAELQEVLTYYEAKTTVVLTIQYADGREYKEKEVKVVLQKQSN